MMITTIMTTTTTTTTTTMMMMMMMMMMMTTTTTTTTTTTMMMMMMMMTKYNDDGEHEDGYVDDQTTYTNVIETCFAGDVIEKKQRYKNEPNVSFIYAHGCRGGRAKVLVRCTLASDTTITTASTPATAAALFDL